MCSLTVRCADPSLPRCIPASTVFSVGSIEHVSRQISTAPLVPRTSLAPLVSETDVRARSLSAPCASVSIASVLRQRRESVLNAEKGRKSTSIEVSWCLGWWSWAAEVEGDCVLCLTHSGSVYIWKLCRALTAIGPHVTVLVNAN